LTIESLGYIGVRSDRLSDWSAFSSAQIGMQVVDRTAKQLIMRMDDHKQRFVVSDEAGDALAYLGWEVASSTALDLLATKVESAGVTVTHAPRALCDRRCVQQMVFFDDPDGNRVELFIGPMIDDQPFTPGRPISGFVTDALGMGHVVLHVRRAERLVDFYQDTLGFAISDYGLTPYPLYFFHVNGRHHSFAIIGSGQRGLHHFMVEYQNLDDVGQGYDIAQQIENRIAYTLGRHTNDYMTSFYANTPSGFFIEHGWGGRIIDPKSWQAFETFDGPSFWGHERLHLAPEKRKVLRDMRLQAAKEGKRAPLLVDCPWLYQSGHR